MGSLRQAGGCGEAGFGGHISTPPTHCLCSRGSFVFLWQAGLPYTECSSRWDSGMEGRPLALEPRAWPFRKPNLTFGQSVSPSLSFSVPTCEMRRKPTLQSCFRDSDNLCWLVCKVLVHKKGAAGGLGHNGMQSPGGTSVLCSQGFLSSRVYVGPQGSPLLGSPGAGLS